MTEPAETTTSGASGPRASFWRRLGAYLIDSVLLFIPWDREKQTWHDKIATTVVVPTSAYPVS